MAITDALDAPLLVGDPAALAVELAATHADDPGWLDAFADALQQQRSANQARRVFAVWGINHSEAGRLFGVTRQAVSRWVIDGIPTSQTVAFADLAAATDILAHYLQADRIPAVVRRPAPALAGLSLVDLLGQGRTGDIVGACKAMFQFAGAHQ
ncbi:MAG: hypothetical protein R2733_16720 [Acidimicrobiales bacterium]